MGLLLHHPDSPDYPFRRAPLSGEEPPSLAHAQAKRNASLLRSQRRRRKASISESTDTHHQEGITDGLVREDLRGYMLTHSLRGTKLAKTRQPFVGELIPLKSPEDHEVVFQIRRLDNRAVMTYRDSNSAVRYIMEEENQRMITEKDFPAGSMRVDVVELGLAGWNITDSGGNIVSLNRESILGYLMPEELDAIYEEVLKVNPILMGETTRKKS